MMAVPVLTIVYKLYLVSLPSRPVAKPMVKPRLVSFASSSGILRTALTCRVKAEAVAPAPHQTARHSDGSGHCLLSRFSRSLARRSCSRRSAHSRSGTQRSSTASRTAAGISRAAAAASRAVLSTARANAAWRAYTRSKERIRGKRDDCGACDGCYFSAIQT